MARILLACEESQIVTEQFILRGHDAMSCDIEYLGAKGLPHYQGDVRDILHQYWDMVIAFPPCDFIANSGVRWLYEKKGRWEAMDKACQFFNLFRTLRHVKKVGIENPIPHKYARYEITKYNQIVQPWYFGDPFFKGTCLWLKNLDELQDTDRLIPPKPGTEEHKKWSAVHQEPPGPNRKRNRSRAFPGIAAAMANQWG